MVTSDQQPDQSLVFRTFIEEATIRSKELRQTIDRIVEVRPNDKSIQELDQLVDVLVIKLLAVSSRATRTGGKPASAVKRGLKAR
jgi:hypothetical protein